MALLYPEFEETQEFSSQKYNGLSALVSSTTHVQNAINVMKSRGLNALRLSFSPSWLGSDYSSTHIQYFLNNAPGSIVIVDRNHLYPNNTTKSNDFRNHLGTARTDLLNLCKAFPNNSRVWIELLNEYVNSDFQSICQGLINNIRNAGYTNKIIVNKQAQSWGSCRFTDSLKKTVVGYHYYFNNPSTTWPESDMKIALGQGFELLNTEIGADYRETSYFTSAKVARMNKFMQWCATNGIGNCAWMNHNGAENWPLYSQLGIKFPVTVVTVPASTHMLSIECNYSGVAFTVNGKGYQTPWRAQVAEGTYQINMPLSVMVNGIPRYFYAWGNGSSNPARVETVDQDLFLGCSYR